MRRKSAPEARVRWRYGRPSPRPLRDVVPSDSDEAPTLALQPRGPRLVALPLKATSVVLEAFALDAHEPRRDQRIRTEPKTGAHRLLTTSHRCAADPVHARIEPGEPTLTETALEMGRFEAESEGLRTREHAVVLGRVREEQELRILYEPFPLRMRRKTAPEPIHGEGVRQNTGHG